MPTRPPSTRLASKELTRQALIRAALKLLSHHSFDSLSLREVTREAGITPTAFYRHYADMEELALVLVEESFRCLVDLVKDARSLSSPEDPIESSLACVVRHLHDHPSHFRFIVRERDGGMRRVRRAIHRELQLVADELALDLAGLPGVDAWTTEDRRMLAGVVVETILRMVAGLLEAGPDEERELVERCTRQLRLLSRAVPVWHRSAAVQ